MRVTDDLLLRRSSSFFLRVVLVVGVVDRRGRGRGRGRRDALALPTSVGHVASTVAAFAQRRTAVGGAIVKSCGRSWWGNERDSP